MSIRLPFISSKTGGLVTKIEFINTHIYQAHSSQLRAVPALGPKACGNLWTSKVLERNVSGSQCKSESLEAHPAWPQRSDRIWGKLKLTSNPDRSEGS